MPSSDGTHSTIQRQRRLRSERGEVASWLIMAAGLCLAAAVTAGPLTTTFVSLVDGLGFGSEILAGPDIDVGPPAEGEEPTAGNGPDDTGKYDDDRRIVGWEEVEDPLYRYGIHPDDVSQGALNDCFFVSTLAALANLDPDIIRDAIVDNGDGTYTVTLYEDGEPVEVTVTGDVPILEYYDEEMGVWRRSSRPPSAGDGDGEVWVRVLEQAYATLLGDGDIIEGYGELNSGGSGSSAIEVLTGLDASYTKDDPSLDRLRELLDQGPVLANSHEYIPGSGWWVFGRQNGDYTVGANQITTWHQYWVDDILPDGTIIVRNPWDFYAERMEMTLEEFNEAFPGITYSDQGR